MLLKREWVSFPEGPQGSPPPPLVPSNQREWNKVTLTQVVPAAGEAARALK